jgi:hypothetical protein
MKENDEDVVHAGIVSNLKKPLNSGRFCNSPPTGVIAQLRAGSLDLKAAVPLLNQSLRSFSQITWLGTFSELLDSSDEFPRKMRAWFRKESDPAAQDPIDESDVKKFRERLLEYCI